MGQAYGLHSHIQANRLRSLFLLASFVLLLQALVFSFNLVYRAFEWGGGIDEILARTFETMGPASLLGLAVSGVWFVIAWFAHSAMIAAATGARDVSRAESPRLYSALENLCISRGIAMPKLTIIDTPALNAFASGMNARNHAIAVTRGLIETLDDREVEAVLGHELTHIRNRDVNVMVIATIFAGIFAFAGDVTFRNWDFPHGWSPKSPASSRGGRGKGGAGILIAIVVALLVIAVSWGVSILIRLAISRAREFMADAGSVELTKNPDAMISALKKIAGRAAIVDMPSRMHAFFIETPAVRPVSSLFATHPPIGERIAALVRHAGGREP